MYSQVKNTWYIINNEWHHSPVSWLGSKQQIAQAQRVSKNELHFQRALGTMWDRPCGSQMSLITKSLSKQVQSQPF
jgi:hypothetical protein